MGYPLGLAPKADGTGLQPADHQQVIGASFHNAGIVPGSQTGEVAGTTAMSYRVEPCTVFLWTSWSTRRGILASVDATTIVTDPAPSTGSRTDYVYVDTTGAVRVQKGGSAPSGVILGRFVVPAGATSTQSIPNTFDRIYAIPAGASLGRMAHWTDPGGGAAGTAPVTRYSKRFVVPMDSVMRVDLTSTIKAATANGVGAMGMTVVIDGTWRRSMSCNYDNRWQTYGASWSTGVLSGAHTVEVETAWSTGDTYQLASGSSITEMALWHMGVSQ